MIKRKNQARSKKYNNPTKPALYNITLYSIGINKEKLNEILLTHFHYKSVELLDEMYEKLNTKCYLNVGNYTKDVAETKLIEINNSVELKEDLNIAVTINNQ